MESKTGEKVFNARGVVAEIIAYRDSFNHANKSKRSTLARNVSLFIWWLGIALTISSYFIARKKLVIPSEYILIYLAVLIVSMISMIVFSYLEYVKDDEFKSFLKDPVSDLLVSSDRALKEEIRLYEKFDEYPAEALIQTRNYLNRKKTLIESISSTMVGVLTKVGLLPALLTTLIIIVKLYKDSGLSPLVMVAFILIGMYFFCFKMIETSVKFDEYQEIINDYIEMRKERH